MNRLATLSGLSALALAAAPLAGLAQEGGTASARIVNAAGAEIGRATFTQIPQGIVIEVEADGLEPGPHGVHLHRTGACAPDFSAAGERLSAAPADAGAEAPGEEGQAVGPADVLAGESGHLEAAFVDHHTRLLDGEGALLDDDGAALVLHSAAGGEAAPAEGGRVACGVLEAAG